MPSTTWKTRPISPITQFAVEIHNPKGEKVVSEAKKADAWGGIEGEYEIPADAPLGVYQSERKRSRRRQFPRRGIQEARVRSHRRRPDRAGHAGREDHRHDQGQVLLRLAGHQGQGEVQGQPHQPRPSGGIPSGRGTGSTGRAIGGSPTITTGIPAGGTGAACGRCRSGGRAAISRRNWSPTRKSRSGRTAR